MDHNLGTAKAATAVAAMVIDAAIPKGKETSR